MRRKIRPLTKKQKINDISIDDSIAICKKHNLLEISFDTKSEDIKTAARKLCRETNLTPKQLL